MSAEICSQLLLGDNDDSMFTSDSSLENTSFLSFIFLFRYETVAVDGNFSREFGNFTKW